MSFKKLVSSSICAAVLCTSVSAQETKPNPSSLPQKGNANETVNKMAAQGMVTPQQLASCWALDNQEEVILAKFAQEKSKNEEVSSFAKMIAEEHQSCLKKLSKFAPDASREGYLADHARNDSSAGGSSSNDQPKKPNPNTTTNPSANAGGSSMAGIDMMQLQRQIAQQCVSDSKKYLSAKEGDEFDKCFVGMQIAKHAAMRTKLVVLQRHSSDEMQQMVAEGIQATEKHMKAAEALMEKLDGDESNNSAKENNK